MPQVALLEGFLSDASAVGATGLRPRTAAIGLPTRNMHGFEVIDEGGIEAVARSLERFPPG
jgi:putative aminopeptidase FrvX